MGAARSQIAGVLPREPHIQGKGSWLFARSLLEDLSQSTSATPNKTPFATVLGSGHLLFPEVTETPHHYLVFGQTTVRLCGWGGVGGSCLLWPLLLACTRGAAPGAQRRLTDTAETPPPSSARCLEGTETAWDPVEIHILSRLKLPDFSVPAANRCFFVLKPVHVIWN